MNKAELERNRRSYGASRTLTVVPRGPESIDHESASASTISRPRPPVAAPRRRFFMRSRLPLVPDSRSAHSG